MAVTSWRYPGTVTEDTSVGARALVNFANLAATGTTYAEVDWPTGSSFSYRYGLHNFNFAAEGIPAGSTINGWEVSYDAFEGSSTDNVWPENLFTRRHDASYQSGLLTTFYGEYSTSKTTYVEGNPASIMNYDAGAYDAPTVANIEDSDFGFGIQFQAISGTTPDAFINNCQMRIYYTAGGGTVVPVFYYHLQQQGIA